MAKYFLAFLITIFLLGQEASAAQDVSAGETVFRKHIADRIPSEIKVIEGAQSQWLDDISCVEFVADEATFQGLLEGYQPMDARKGRYSMPSYIPKEFEGDNTKYFRKTVDRESKDSKFRDYYYLARNSENNRTYFYFTGGMRFPKDQPMPPVDQEL